MSKLISGKEALIALANGTKPGEIEGKFAAGASQFEYVNMEGKTDLFVKYLHDGIFRIKPRTITINGIEVPAPFEPKDGDEVWCISDDHGYGYCMYDWQINHSVVIGVWRTEEEIKQVVSALRSVFKPQ